jgi:hypothetical protein
MSQNTRINYQGYILDPKNISQDDINKLINDLTVIIDKDKKPDDEDNKFLLYQKKKLFKYVIPRYYGFKIFCFTIIF